MKELTRWYSERLEQEVGVTRYGVFGKPVLLFPTAAGDAEECERFHLIDSLSHLLEGGRIKVYSCDSVAGRAWVDSELPGTMKARVQNCFDSFVIDEVVPSIYQDCHSPEGIEIITAGASIGAFNALASLCRHPETFQAAICMSGSYDLEEKMRWETCLDFYYSSPLHFVPNLDQGAQLEQLRRRFVILATGEGAWEDPGQTWNMAHVLGQKGIPNRVDLWGEDAMHDWPTWRRMLPHYLSELT